MIYLDNAATTPVKREVYEKMLPYFSDYFGNPSGIYELSVKSKKAMEESRGHIADLIGADSDEIYFTSGGTESDNWALKGCAELLKDKGNHIITTKIEHHAILNSCKYLEDKGFEVSYVDVDEYGMIKLEMLKKAIKPSTILISVMMANNEIGTIQPIEEIGAIAKMNNIVFHTDAVQACGHIPIDVGRLGVSLLSASGHKFGGPKGVGFLYIKKGINLPSFIHGGNQENGLRAGTGNVPLVVGMGEAAKASKIYMDSDIMYVTRLREYALKRILREVPFVRLNGHRVKRLPGNMNFSFQFAEGEAIQIMLDMKGICVSTGSACSSGNNEVSHVLEAIGLTKELSFGAVRFTISRSNTKEELDKVINILKEILFKQREMSSEYKEIMLPYKRYGKRR